MPQQYLTLKDITALNAGSAEVGLVENIVNVAPELDRVLGRPISGISFEASILTAIGSNAAFRAVGSGVQLSAPSVDLKRFNCFPFDCQMRVGEDLIIQRAGQGESMGSVFTTHATAAMRQKALRCGIQFYQGSLNDPNGPPGLIDFLTTQRTQVDSRTGLKIDQAVDAGGNAAGACQVVWFIKMGPQGVHWMFGNGRGILMNPWRPQQVESSDSTPGNKLFQTAWVANTFGYLGLGMAGYHAVGAIINVNATATTVAGVTTYPNALTDAQVAALWAKFPITEKPDLAFCTQNAAASLQLTRTVTNFVSSTGREWTGGAAPVADFPTRLPTAGNIPLIVTDSIPVTNQLVLN